MSWCARITQHGGRQWLREQADLDGLRAAALEALHEGPWPPSAGWRPAPHLNPASAAAARDLLVELGAPARLLRHVDLVGEAAELILAPLSKLGLELQRDLVRVGVVLHDVGKILHPGELDRPGGDHEPAGEALLLEHGASPEVARICLSHARWTTMTASLEELLVALSDKLWKGVRKAELEERVITEVASRLERDRWSLFIELDTVFERIAAGGTERLERSRV